jgi:hypothetical protein
MSLNKTKNKANTMKTYPTQLLFSSVLFLCISWGCHPKKDDPSPSQSTEPSYSVPTYYNGFSNVDHTESTTILGMLSELGTEIAKGTGATGATVPVSLDKGHLLNLLKNMNNEFSNASYNTSGFQIQNNCLAASQAIYESFLDSLVAVSSSSHTASSGIAGLGISKDATPRRFLLTAKGMNYSQILNKTIMGDLIYYQIATRLANSVNLDNSARITSPYDSTKKYTAMEHNWDVAFGYWSVPDSFPTKTSPLKFWGSYSNQVNAGLGSNSLLMNAFLKGRAAITNKDMATMKAQADIIIAEFELMTGGALCQELNEIQIAINAGDAVKVVSIISEYRGFVQSMYNIKSYYPGRKITDAQIDTLLSLLPANNWDFTQTDLNNIRSYVCSVYGFTNAQSLIL